MKFNLSVFLNNFVVYAFDVTSRELMPNPRSWKMYAFVFFQEFSFWWLQWWSLLLKEGKHYRKQESVHFMMPDTMEKPGTEGRMETVLLCISGEACAFLPSLPYAAPPLSGSAGVCVCARDVVECGCRSRAGAAPSLSMPTSCQSLFRRELPPSRLFQHHHLLAPHCKMTWWLCLVQTVAGLWHRVWDSGSVLTDVYSTHHSRVETSYRD